MSARRRYGEQAACGRCGQDIEWHGRKVGWIDRGSGRQCLPYQPNPNADFIRPGPKALHAPDAEQDQ